MQQKGMKRAFGEAKGWNLLADGYDETKLRNQIVFGLAAELEIEYTPDRRSVGSDSMSRVV